MANGHSLRPDSPELNSISNVQICLGQVRYAAFKLALNSFLVSDHGHCSVYVAACNLFARKLNFFARAAMSLLSIVAAVSTVAGATGLSHILIIISLAACNKGVCLL